MIYAIGKPGEAVRMYMETEDEERVALQIGEGEVFFPVEDRRPATISASKVGGTYVLTLIASPTPAWNAIRFKRNLLLSASDWSMLPDSPLSDEQKAAWVDYRQALRDVPEQSDPDNIVWPTAPG